MNKGMKTLIPMIEKKSPAIFVGCSIIGSVSSTAFAIKATPTAIKKLEETKEELKKEKLSAKDCFKAVWKLYLPSAISLVVSSACSIASLKINDARNAALMATCGISEKMLSQYQTKLIEAVGKEEAKTIEKEIGKDISKEVSTNKEIYVYEGDEVTFYESLTGRYFKSTVQKVNDAVNKLNRDMRYCDITLNDYLYELGLKGIDIGETVGWNIDSGYIDISICGADDPGPDGKPAFCIMHHNRPSNIE